MRRSAVSWQLLSVRGWIRLWFTLRETDASAAWARRVGKAALALADPTIHSAIITSGPPHSWYEAGRRASVASGVPLVLDLRDPWSVAEVVHEYFATPASLAVAAAQESRAVRQAALIVVNTEPLREAMAARYPDAASRIVTVMNGYDDSPVPEFTGTSTFTIGYAGSIYAGRDPRPLFSGAAAVIRGLSLTPKEILVRLIGNVRDYGGVPLMTLAENAGIAAYVRVEGRASQEDAWRFMAACQMLVSLPWDDGLTIPAKLFEYMRFPAWLLVYAEAGSALERVTKGLDVDVVGNRDAAGTSAAIRRRYDQFLAGSRPQPLAEANAFSRQAQADILRQALHQVLDKRATQEA